MRYLFMELTNYIGIYNGMRKDHIEIDFTNSHNRIVLLSGANGTGKSTIINALSLLPDGNESFVPLKSAMKYLKLTDGINIYEITFAHPVDKNGHRSVTKISLVKNGVELNPNGNVSSYKDIIFNELDIDSNLLSLTSVSTNNRGLADKRPAERKKIMSSLISSLDAYNEIYKNLNKKSNVFKSYVNNLSSKIQSAGDESLLRETLGSLRTKETRLTETINASRDKIVEFKTLLSVNDKDGSLKQQYDELIARKNELEQEKLNKYQGLINYKDKYKSNYNFDNIPAELESCNSLLEQYTSEHQKAISDNNALLLNINSVLSDIEQLKVKIDKLYENTDSEIERNLDKYQTKMNGLISDFEKIGIDESNIDNVTIDDINGLLEIYNDIVLSVDRLYELSTNEDLLELLDNPEQKCQDIINQEQITKDNISKLIMESSIMKNDVELVKVLDNRPKTCKDDLCVFVKAALDTANKYNGAKELNKLYEKTVKNLEKEQQSLENIQNTLIPHANHLLLLNNIFTHIFDTINNNKRLLSKFKLSSILLDYDKLLELICKNEYRFNEFRDINAYIDWSNSILEYKSTSKILSELRAKYEIYQHNIEMISDFEQDKANKEEQLQKYKDTHSLNSKEIEFTKGMIDSINNKMDVYNNYSVLYNEWKSIDDELSQIKANSDKINESFKSSLDLLQSINDLETLVNESVAELTPVQDQIKSIDTQLTLIADFKNDYEIYKNKFDFITTLRNYSSPTSAGIQSLYMSIYMDRTLDIVNQLLGMLFSGQYQILQYIINEEEFRIPFIGNGMTVDDISSGSTSQVCMMGMIINLVLASMCSSKYNIVCLDEIDSGLDNQNKYMFIDILNKISDILNIEQIFVISHSIESSISNIDVVLTSDSQDYRDLFSDANIIYHNKLTS